MVDEITAIKEAVRVLDTVPFERARNAKVQLLRIVDSRIATLRKECKHIEFEVKHFGLDKQQEVDDLMALTEQLEAWVKHYAN